MICLTLGLLNNILRSNNDRNSLVYFGFQTKNFMKRELNTVAFSILKKIYPLEFKIYLDIVLHYIFILYFVFIY